jgi:hypothetical protein
VSTLRDTSIIEHLLLLLTSHQQEGESPRQDDTDQSEAKDAN